ncbi:MAG: hypothetical protein AAGA73_01125 [Pseudomonadota bacterium]
MRILKTAATACFLICAFSDVTLATDRKFSGTWQSINGRTTYTVMVVHDEKTITYCYVQSCRQHDCWTWDIEGTTEGVFTYENYAGFWEFERLEEDVIEGTYTNPAGDTSFVFYNPHKKYGYSSTTAAATN